METQELSLTISILVELTGLGNRDDAENSRLELGLSDTSLPAVSRELFTLLAHTAAWF